METGACACTISYLFWKARKPARLYRPERYITEIGYFHDKLPAAFLRARAHGEATFGKNGETHTRAVAAATRRQKTGIDRPIRYARRIQNEKSARLQWPSQFSTNTHRHCTTLTRMCVRIWKQDLPRSFYLSRKRGEREREEWTRGAKVSVEKRTREGERERARVQTGRLDL